MRRSSTSLSAETIEADFWRLVQQLGVPIHVPNVDPDALQNDAWDNVEDAASLHAQAQWMALPAVEVHTLAIEVNRATAWRSSVRGALSAAEQPGRTALLVELQRASEALPMIHTLPESEELKLAVARQELIGS